MYKLIVLLSLLLVMNGCTGETVQKTSDRINGSWHNGRSTITIDLHAGTLSGVITGESVLYRIAVVREEGRTVVLRADDTTMFATLRDNGTLVLIGETGGPRTLIRLLW